MAEFERLGPRTILSPAFGSVATNGSSTLLAWVAPAAGQITGARIVNNSAGSTIASGTTAGSAVTISLYKTASAAASLVASFNGSGTTVASLNTAALIVNTATAANQRFVAGDLFLVEYTGGAANNVSNAGCAVSIEFILGRENGATPSAATGPA